MPLFYLAGPEVFRPDAEAEGERLKALCAAEGVSGRFPLDDQSGTASAEEIRAHCIAGILSADAVIANISPFRGPHMDPGTAWELGFAEARGKPIFLWSSAAAPLVTRIAATDGRDADGHLVEDFGAPENLMITLGHTPVHDSAAGAIAAAAAAFRPAQRAREAGGFRLGILQMIGIAAAIAFIASWLGDKFLFK